MPVEIKNKSKYFNDVLAIIITALGLFNTWFFLPAILFSPVLICKTFFRKSIFETVYLCITIFVFNLICSVVTGHTTTFYAFCFSASVIAYGIILGLGFRKKNSFKDIYTVMTLFNCALVVVIFAFIKLKLDINIHKVVRSELIDGYNAFVRIVKYYNPQITEVISIDNYDYINMFYMIIPGLLPFFVVLFSGITSAIQYCVAKFMCISDIINTNNFNDGIDKFKITWITNFILVLTQIIVLADFNAFLTMMCLNLVFVILAVICLNGFAVIYFKIKLKVCSHSIRILLVIGFMFLLVAVSLVFPIINGVYLLIFIGITDCIFDYRKLKEIKEGYYEE